MAPKVLITVDTVLNAAYVQLSDGTVARTVEYDDAIMVDLDQHDVVVGIELLHDRVEIPFDDLTAKFHVRSETVALLRHMAADDFSWLFDIDQGNEGSATANSGSSTSSGTMTPA